MVFESRRMLLAPSQMVGAVHVLRHRGVRHVVVIVARDSPEGRIHRILLTLKRVDHQFEFAGFNPVYDGGLPARGNPMRVPNGADVGRRHVGLVSALPRQSIARYCWILGVDVFSTRFIGVWSATVPAVTFWPVWVLPSD